MYNIGRKKFCEYRPSYLRYFRVTLLSFEKNHTFVSHLVQIQSMIAKCLKVSSTLGY
jgi:hypothetical protein